ncbi:MAG: hypothetical protein NTX64_18945 [Elusimicrobia bacterium]|nr:hypothetical protein [Elusimicrobiota bacterium]
MELTEREKLELLEMSRSAAVRADFRRLRAAAAEPLPAEAFLDFLTSASELFPPPPQAAPKRYTRVLL